MSEITVVIPAKNEAKNLASCIAAVTALGPIVVVDSGSMDDTKTIAKAAGPGILDFEWNGHFPKKRNWTLRKYDFKTKKVISEQPTQAMQLEISLLPTPGQYGLDCQRSMFLVPGFHVDHQEDY